jgi:hypothetical protein
MDEKNGRYGRRPDDGRSDRWSLAALGILPLAVLCCGLPGLLAAGGLAAIGGWMGAQGFWLGGAILVAVAAGVGGRWWMTRRRCTPGSPGSRAPERR